MLEQTEKTSVGQIARGSSARHAAALFNYGNIIAIIIVPLVIVWFGASMFVYAINHRHPNPKVGYYTQRAAYRFYGVTGFLLACALFFPGGSWTYYLIAWGLAAAIIIPWSIWDLIRIYRDEWVDVVVDEEEE